MFLCLFADMKAIKILSCGTVFCTLACVAQIKAVDQYFIMITFRKHSDWFLSCLFIQTV